LKESIFLFLLNDTKKGKKSCTGKKIKKPFSKKPKGWKVQALQTGRFSQLLYEGGG